MATAKRPKAQGKSGGHYKAEALRKAKTLGLRITEADKELLEAAANKLGVPLSEFVLSAALERACATLRK
jgi:uncharacterized protein (DUF1778 family)